MRGRTHGVDLDLYLTGYPKEKISREEEQELGALPFNDTRRWKLVLHNMRFAVMMCLNAYSKNRLVSDFSALLASAEEAMIEVALRRFINVGNSFIAYASHYVRKNINNEVHRQLCVVKHPAYTKANKPKLREDANYQESIDGVDECHLGIIDTSLASMEDEELHKHLIAEISRVVKNPFHRKVMIMYYFGDENKEPMTIKEIITKVGGYTREGIRKIIVTNTKKLRSSALLMQHLGV